MTEPREPRRQMTDDDCDVEAYFRERDRRNPPPAPMEESRAQDEYERRVYSGWRSDDG